MSRSSDRRSALAALAAAGALFGLTIPLSKPALGWLDPPLLATVRFALAAPLLLLCARRRPRAAAGPLLALWGGIGFGVPVLLQSYGVERTSVSHAALIVGAVPVLVALAAAASGDGVARPLAWVGFAAGLAGVGLVAGEGGGAASLEGDLLVLASAVVIAVFMLTQARFLPGRDPVALTGLQMAAAAGVCGAVALAGASVPGTPAPGAAAAVAGLVLAGSLIPFALWSYGAARVPAVLAGAFTNVEPLVGVAAGVLAFGNALGPAQVAGAAAIAAGIALSARRA